MSPPVTVGFPKKVPPEGDEICGKPVPGGSNVYMNLIAAMNNTEVFGHDAKIFRPERFLDCDEVIHNRRLKTVELLFGAGRWMCLGKVLARMELNKVYVEVNTPITTCSNRSHRIRRPVLTKR
jgi:cytochrome P450